MNYGSLEVMVSDYPEFADNPVPRDGDEAAWRHWVEHCVILEESRVRCLEAGPEQIVFVMTDSPLRLNPIGSVHGGMVAALADCAAGCAFVRTVAPGLLPATATLTVDYHRPAFAPLTFTARVTNAGRTLVFCEVDVTDAEGRLCNRAHAVMAVKGTPLANGANDG